MTSKAKIKKAERYGHLIRAMPLKHREGCCPRWVEREDLGYLKVHTRKFFYGLH
jgi:hypothetical protein